jgi:phosphatidylglycerophosphatase A
MFIKPKILVHPLAWIALGFGTGLSPSAPGTLGSLAAAVLWWLLFAQLSLTLQIAIITLGLVLGIWASHWMIGKIGVQDPACIVWDEFIGQWIALLCLPKTLFWYTIGFALFRLFDIIKKGPVGWVDKHFKGGFGVMMDDVLAGVLALLVGQIMLAHF